MAAAAWAPPESDFGSVSSWAPPESDFGSANAPSGTQAAFAAANPGADASMQRAHDIAMGTTPAPGPTGVQQAGAVGEAALQAATGVPAQLAGGLSYLGTLAATQDTAAAKEVQEATGKALTYEPRLETTKAAETTIGNAASKAGGAAVNYLSDKAATFGGPTAGNLVQTVLPAAAQAAPWLLGAPGLASAGAGVVGAVERGVAREAASTVAPAEAAAAAPEAPAAAAPPPESPGLAILKARPTAKPPTEASSEAAPAPAQSASAPAPVQPAVAGAGGVEGTAAAPAPPPVVVQHSADEATGEHTVTATAANGTTGSALAQESGPYLLTKRIDASAPGQGVGTAMLQRLQSEAQSRGLTLGTDISTSPQLQRAVDNLQTQGYTVKENPNTINPATGNKVSADIRVPVHEITAPPAAAAGEAAISAPAAANTGSIFRTPVEMGAGGAGGVGEAAPAAQAERAATLNRLGVQEAHPGAVSGDPQAAADALVASKLNSEAGERFRGVFSDERQALRESAADVAAGTGGPVGMEPSAAYARGSDIAAVPNAYRDYIEAKTQQAYQAATAKNGDKPLATPSFKGFLADNNAEFLGTTEGKQLLEGVQARARDLGLHNDTGNVLAAERMRQYLGNQWTPRTSRLIGAMKDALDDDVAKTVGPGTFEAGRALRNLRDKVIDQPDGISALLKPDDKLGINRPVALESIPQFTEKMPQDQFSHLMDVMSDAAKTNPALAKLSERAINAIRAHFASRVQQIGDSTNGMWNNGAVSTYLRSQEPKLQQVFTPEELARFKDINDGGNYLAPDRTYRGAAVQAHNLLERGVKFGEPLVEAVGAHAFGLPGYAAARGLSMVARKMIPETGTLKDAEKVIERPKDYLK